MKDFVTEKVSEKNRSIGGACRLFGFTILFDDFHVFDVFRRREKEKIWFRHQEKIFEEEKIPILVLEFFLTEKTCSSLILFSIDARWNRRRFLKLTANNRLKLFNKRIDVRSWKRKFFDSTRKQKKINSTRFYLVEEKFPMFSKIFSRRTSKCRQNRSRKTIFPMEKVWIDDQKSRRDENFLRRNPKSVQKPDRNRREFDWVQDLIFRCL